jgi:hypothetical protein
LSRRQIKRVWRRYQDEGDAGPVHRGCGRPSAWRKSPALRVQVLEFCADQCNVNFGPTLLVEHLARRDPRARPTSERMPPNRPTK